MERRLDRDSPLLGWSYDNFPTQDTPLRKVKKQRAKSGRRGQELLGCMKTKVTEMSLTTSASELRRVEWAEERVAHRQDPGFTLKAVPRDAELLHAPRYRPRQLGVSLVSLLWMQSSVHIRQQFIRRPVGLPARAYPLKYKSGLKVVGTNISKASAN